MTNRCTCRRTRIARCNTSSKLHPRILAAADPATHNTAKPPSQLYRSGIARRYHVLLDAALRLLDITDEIGVLADR